ncbi:MAG: hypothetical protein IJG70_08115 [Kiritimatiellae bacterium]|nr:hypothetical protein [Kiritimatiellia bacterium]
MTGFAEFVRPRGCAAVLLCLAAAGCFDEPTPAYKTVPEGARVYLQDQGLKDLSSCKDALRPDVVDYLNLDRNQLTNVDAVASLAGLKWLRLNENRLAALPDLSGLKKLRRVYLRNNKFTQVPETLKDLPELTDLDLSWNDVTEVPDWLAKREGLENLSFTHTKIRQLPADLGAWRSLKSLQLGDLDLNPAELSRIRAALPDVAIVF